MAFNVDNLIIDRIRQITAHNITTGELLYRLTEVEDASLNCSSEAQEITDAVGARITTLYRAKQGELTGSASLLSLSLLADQWGAKKEIGSDEKKITVPAYDVLTVTGADSEVVKLAKAPKAVDNIKFAYSIVSGEIGDTFTVGAAADDKTLIIAEDGTVTPPTNFKGKLFVEYEYETANANRVVNMADQFPTNVKLIVDVIFRSVCDDSIVYAGKILCPKAKSSAESVEVSMTPDGKHPFTYQILKDFCGGDDQELFEIIVAE